ncbi:hypothetical protein ACMFMG_004291 [Clarireedia jacksonii]
MFTARTLLSVFAVTALSTIVAATGASVSPGFISGNLAQVPINVPINVCGNTVSVIGLPNLAFGNGCTNDSLDLRQLLTPVTVTVELDSAINAYVFQVSPGVKLDLCGVKTVSNGKDEFEFSCNAEQSVTIG